MRVNIVQQPFDPRGVLSRLGLLITTELISGRYNRVHIFSGYVLSSGTQRLSPALHAVTCAGGSVRALIGVNNGLTSMQAVADLHAAGVEVLGLHTGGSVLYHPKVYLLSSADRAWISVGSSNLTGEGMYRNIETNTVIELDLAIEVEKHVLDEMLAWFQYFQDTYRRNTIRIAPESIQGLVVSRILTNEIEMARETRRVTEPGAPPRRGAPDDSPPRIAVPALPTATGYRPVQRRVRRDSIAREENSSVAPTTQTRFFAMTLSAHDASKRTGECPVHQNSACHDRPEGSFLV